MTLYAIWAYIQIVLFFFFCIDKGLISKIYKQLMQLNIKKHLNQKQAEELNRHFSKEDMQMANKHLKRCSTSLIITEIQSKTKTRYQLIPVIIAIIKKSKNNKHTRGCRDKEALTAGGNVNWYSHYGDQYGGSLKT